MKKLKIKILGAGCAKCNQLTSAVESVAKELNLDIDIEKITDLSKIMAFGVMMTPALVINDEVKTMGKIPASDELKSLLSASN